MLLVSLLATVLPDKSIAFFVLFCCIFPPLGTLSSIVYCGCGLYCGRTIRKFVILKLRRRSITTNLIFSIVPMQTNLNYRVTHTSKTIKQIMLPSVAMTRVKHPTLPLITYLCRWDSNSFLSFSHRSRFMIQTEWCAYTGVLPPPIASALSDVS